MKPPQDFVDLYELLTSPLDEETENYLKRQGLDWFLSRRKRFLEFLHRKEATA